MPRFPLLETIAARLLSPVLSELREDLHASESHRSILRDERDDSRLALAEAQGGAREGAWAEANTVTCKGEPARAELRRITQRSRALALRNPLTKRGISVQSFYTFGRGVSLSSSHEGAKKALADFTGDPSNAWLFQAWSAAALDRELAATGNLFFAFFTTPQTGRVVMRLFDVDDIEDVIRAAGDKFTPLFYQRSYSKTFVNEHGRTVTETVSELYPDYKHNPAAKPPQIDGRLVNWDVPVMHVKTGGLLGWKFGVAENWAGQDWARGYSNFLQDRATVAKALAQFSLKVTRALQSAGASLGIKPRAPATRAPEGTGAGPGRDAAGRTTDPNSQAGNTANLGAGTNLEAVTVKGATIDPDEGRRLSLMVACDAGIPETYYGDASVGTLATAQSLDWPTNLMFGLRQGMYKFVLAELGFVALKAAAYAKRNGFTASYGLEGFAPVLKGADGKPIAIDVDFPPLIEHDVDQRTQAIERAAKYLPGPAGRKYIARQMLVALGEDDVDDVLDEIDFSQPEPPTVPPATDATLPIIPGPAPGADSTAPPAPVDPGA